MTTSLQRQLKKRGEEKTIQEALQKCGYPPWTFGKVKDQMATKQKKKYDTKKKNDDTTKSNGFVVLPYVKGVTAFHGCAGNEQCTFF